MTAGTSAKADRMLAGGRVRPLAEPAQVFVVDGDTGQYLVTVTASVRTCSCQARVGCSHIEAAVKLLLSSGRERAGYDRAIADRRARASVAAARVFERLGA